MISIRKLLNVLTVADNSKTRGHFIKLIKFLLMLPNYCSNRVVNHLQHPCHLSKELEFELFI